MQKSHHCNHQPALAASIWKVYVDGLNNNTISREELLQRLNWRYATKQFDSRRTIPSEDWAALEEALRLNPSSGGLQPWKLIVITDPVMRAKLLPASYGQPQKLENYENSTFLY